MECSEPLPCPSGSLQQQMQQLLLFSLAREAATVALQRRQLRVQQQQLLLHQLGERLLLQQEEASQQAIALAAQEEKHAALLNKLNAIRRDLQLAYLLRSAASAEEKTALPDSLSSPGSLYSASPAVKAPIEKRSHAARRDRLGNLKDVLQQQQQLLSASVSALSASHLEAELLRREISLFGVLPPDPSARGFAVAATRTGEGDDGSCTAEGVPILAPAEEMSGILPPESDLLALEERLFALEAEVDASLKELPALEQMQQHILHQAVGVTLADREPTAKAPAVDALDGPAKETTLHARSKGESFPLDVEDACYEGRAVRGGSRIRPSMEERASLPPLVNALRERPIACGASRFRRLVDSTPLLLLRTRRMQQRLTRLRQQGHRKMQQLQEHPGRQSLSSGEAGAWKGGCGVDFCLCEEEPADRVGLCTPKASARGGELHWYAKEQLPTSYGSERGAETPGKNDDKSPLPASSKAAAPSGLLRTPPPPVKGVSPLDASHMRQRGRRGSLPTASSWGSTEGRPQEQQQQEHKCLVSASGALFGTDPVRGDVAGEQVADVCLSVLCPSFSPPKELKAAVPLPQEAGCCLPAGGKRAVKDTETEGVDHAGAMASSLCAPTQFEGCASSEDCFSAALTRLAKDGSVQQGAFEDAERNASWALRGCPFAAEGLRPSAEKHGVARQTPETTQGQHQGVKHQVFPLGRSFGVDEDATGSSDSSSDRSPLLLSP
ncbi:hypothetical protein cyc_01464 [Cyclospora cayetanensis]|uniref:Uncharacterized protein n=1 Tax=Cyclospora cayetanensis TaxID=88456 RepID=A0A1D3CR22_9EIME|nr:hypothetical protein cyc_01464 [Cyclospora cayetanensis]